jgi:DNA polymerase elongation subunit (family B)
MSQSKCLVLDIETAPILAYVWGIRDQHIAVNQIHHDWHVIGWAAKWLGDAPSKTFYADQRNAKQLEDDREILERLWKLLDEADIVVTQNGQNFDAPKLNARFILNGIKPPSPYKHLDTYQIVKRVAHFTSNKLEYLTDKICTKYKKLAHTKFPGMLLWKQCLAGNKSAWDEMRKYNIHDVLATEELYLKIQAWAPEHFPKPYDVTDKSHECGTCGFVGKMREGKPRKAKTYKFRQHACLKCGAWSKGERIK